MLLQSPLSLLQLVNLSSAVVTSSFPRIVQARYQRPVPYSQSIAWSDQERSHPQRPMHTSQSGRRNFAKGTGQPRVNPHGDEMYSKYDLVYQLY